MDTSSKKNHTIDVVFVLCLMFLFIFSALSVIAIGASIYKKNVAFMSENNSHRIACAYVTEKIRQSDINGDIKVEEIFGKNALVMTEKINDIDYNTYIYDFEGNLMELFAQADLTVFYPQSGQSIMEIKSFDIEAISDDMFSVKFVFDSGAEELLYIGKRSEDTD